MKRIIFTYRGHEQLGPLSRHLIKWRRATPKELKKLRKFILDNPDRIVLTPDFIGAFIVYRRQTLGKSKNLKVSDLINRLKKKFSFTELPLIDLHEKDVILSLKFERVGKKPVPVFLLGKAEMF